MATALSDIYAKLSEHPEYQQSIISITYLPEECVDPSKLIMEEAGGLRLNVVTDFNEPIKRDVMSVDKYEGYPQVKESKLLTYPYSYVEATAYNGETLELYLEHFDNNKIEFESWGFMNPDSRLAYVVKNYNKDTSLNNALIIKDFPLLPTASNSYDTYLSRSKTSLMLNYGLGAATVVGGLATGNVLAAGMGASGIAQTLAKQEDMKHRPNSINTQMGGSGFNIANGLKGFTLKKKMIKPEKRAILESYWHTYGYKVNRMKKPNLDTRKHFNYVKTIGANIVGDVPHEHLNKIKEMFNNGVTLWHGDFVGDYSKENEEYTRNDSPGDTEPGPNPSQRKFILPYGDSKIYGAGMDGSGQRGFPPMLAAKRTQDTVLTPIARPGYEVIQMVPLIEGDIAKYERVTDVLFNLGTNDIGPNDPPLNAAAWQSNVLMIIDKLQQKFNCNVYLTRVWREDHNGQLNDLNDKWLPEIVGKRENVYLGIDERTILPDNNSDGIHPNKTGYEQITDQWNEVLG